MLKKWLAILLTSTVMTTMIFGNIVQAEELAPSTALYKDSTASVEDRVKDLLSNMTLEEKVGQMTQAERLTATESDIKQYSLGSILSGGGSAPTNNTAEGWADMIDGFQTASMNSRLGIPLLYGVDAVHGHNNVTGTTVFPHNIGLGATGDTDLIKEIGQATAEELRASGVNWTFAPMLGIPQNERWGRTYEGFGEQSQIVTAMGDAYIRGLQGDDPSKTLLRGDKVIATAKHYIGEGLTEEGINKGNVNMDEAEFESVLRNELLPPYAKAVEDGVRTVMVSYNSVNGVKCHANGYLVNQVLKEELGFSGIVVTDWEGIDAIDGTSSARDKIKLAINSGVDMAMVPNTWRAFIDTTISLVKAGEISEERIDDAVSRILRVKFEMGLFEDPYTQRDLLATVGSEEHREIARQAVRESLVLLKNDNDVVGSLKDKKNIAVVGKSADDIGIQCGGWTIAWQGQAGNVTAGTTILKGIESQVSSDAKVTYSKNGRISVDSDVVIAVLGEYPYAETDGDRTPEQLALDKEDLKTLENVKLTNPNAPIVAVLVTGRPITIVNQIEDFDGIVAAWLPGTEGQGVADVLFGDYDFTGKLSITWPWYATDIENKHEEGKALFEYGHGLKKGETFKIPNKPEGPTEPEVEYKAVPATGTTKVEIEECFTQSGFDDEDTQDVGGGKNFGWTDAGDYADFNLDIEADGKYQVEFRVASPDGAKGGAQLLSGSKLLTTVDINKTGGWQNWQSVSGTANIKAGKQVIRFRAGTGGFNINYFTLTKIGEYEDDTTEPEDPTGEIGDVIEAGAVKVWMSSSEQSQSMDWYNSPKEISNKLSEKEPLDITSIKDSQITTINIDPSKEYQNFLGMGTSLEESTINNLAKMSPEARGKFIRDLIDPVNGAGMTLMRVTIGTADFTGQKFYTYYDNAPKGDERDWYNETGKGFSIQKDIDYHIVDTIKQLLDIAEELGVKDQIKIFASAWTPPGWMKLETASSKSYKDNDLLLKGGKLNDEYIGDLAKYYTRYLEEYSKLGIEMYAMTLQNEPELEINYPSCSMTAKQEAKLAKAIKDEVAKSEILTESGVNPKLWAFDHNFSSAISFMNTAFADKDGYSSIDGVAFHDYSGEPTVMSQMNGLYPEKTMNLTERSLWGTKGADRIAQFFRNWAESYNAWVTMLDSNIAPEQWTGTPDPSMFVQDAGNRDNYWATPEFYISGQFSKFIRPGYVRIDSNYGSASTVTNVAFKNPETNEIVTVVVNQTDKTQNFRIVSNGTQINGSIPGGNVATYVWNPVENINKVPSIFNSSKYVEGNVVRVDGDHIGYMKDDSWVDYILDVAEPGLYDVTFEVASDDSSGIGKKIDILQGEKKLSSVDVPVTTWGWGNYFTVKNTVKFDASGTQKIRLDIAGGEFNIRNIKFEKVKEIYNLPGRLLGKNYIDSKGIVVKDNSIEFLDANDYFEYNVNVAEAGKYNLNLNVASAIDTSAFDIYSGEEMIGEIKLTNTGGWDKYSIQSAKIDLKAGEQKLRFVVKDGFNLAWFSVGSAIALTYDEIVEGLENGKVITVNLADGTFVDKLSKDNWKLENLPSGVDFDVARVSDTEAKITLKENSSKDFDSNKLVNVSMAAEEIVGLEGKSYSIEDAFVIKAVDDKETISVKEKEIAMNTDSIIVSIAGGTFNKDSIKDISISGSIVNDGYVKIKAVEYLDSERVKINLEWLKKYYENLPLTINAPAKVYSDSTGDLALTTEVTCSGIAEDPKTITLGNDKVTLAETDAYRSKGSLQSGVEAGNRLDYFLDVKDAGEYTISYSIKNNGAVQNAIKISQGFGTTIDSNLVSLSLPNFWDATNIIKDTLTLQAGKQTLRFEANNAGFEIKSISIAKKAASQKISDTTTVKADSLFTGSRENSYGIQGSGSNTNIGYTVKGTYLDYAVNVEKSGIYLLSYNYATNSGSIPYAVLRSVTGDNVKELGRTELPNTGAWENYKASQKIPARLEAGEQILRIYVDVDGFNYRSFTLEAANDTVAPNIIGFDNTVLEVGSELTETVLRNALGLKVVDDLEGDITNNAIVNFENLDINAVGEYKIKVTASDSTGNKAEKEFTVRVAEDTSKPVIEGHNVNLVVNSKFNPIVDLGLKVTDNKDGDITDKAIITHTVDTSKDGVFRVKVAAKDSAGNLSERYFIVRVLSSGVINGIDLTLKVGDTFDPLAGVTATDINGSDITSKINIVSNNVNTTIAGTYKVVYSVVNSENEVITLTRTIIVEAIEEPEHPEKGQLITSELTLKVGDELNPLDGVKAIDIDGSDITSKVQVVSNNVDTTKAGIYTVVYSVVDNAGNTITISRTVTVVGDQGSEEPQNPETPEEPENPVDPEVPSKPGNAIEIIDENGNKVVLVSKIEDKNGNTIINVDNANNGFKLQIEDINAVKEGKGSIQIITGNANIKLPFSIFNVNDLTEGSIIDFNFLKAENAEITKNLKGPKDVFTFTLSIVKGDRVIPVSSFASGKVDITLTLSDIELKGLDKDKLGVFYYNETNKKFDYLDSKMDGNKITFSASHFSKYVIAEKEIAKDGVTVEPELPRTGAIFSSYSLAIIGIIITLAGIVIFRKKRVFVRE